MKLTGDNLEYAISQYLDGTLSDLDRRVLEDQLAGDAEARLMLEEYRHLNAIITRETKLELPVNFDKLSAHLSKQIELEPAHITQPMRLQSVWVKRLSIAAGIALFAAVGYQFIPGNSQIAKPNMLPDNSQMLVTGPVIENTKDTGTISISVGPTDQLRQTGMSMSLVDETFASPAPKVVISSGNKQTPSSSDERLY